jgi:hypothetical protein
MFVLGLRAAGYGGHERVREGERMIVDRLLPGGGANYGNTIVLGQPLVPHIQPTGLAMLALGGMEHDDPRISKSLEYLAGATEPKTAAPSLAFAALGLAAHGKRSSTVHEWIVHALQHRAITSEAPYELALLLLSAATDDAIRGVTRPVAEAL